MSTNIEEAERISLTNYKQSYTQNKTNLSSLLRLFNKEIQSMINKGYSSAMQINIINIALNLTIPNSSYNTFLQREFKKETLKRKKPKRRKYIKSITNITMQQEAQRLDQKYQNLTTDLNELYKDIKEQ